MTRRILMLSISSAVLFFISSQNTKAQEFLPAPKNDSNILSDLESILPAKTIDIPLITAVELTPKFDLLQKLNEKDDELASMLLRVGDKNIHYYENRITKNGTRTKKKISDPEREIGLKLLNLVSGEVSLIKITKHGNKLIGPKGYEIEVVERPSGIRWNGKNTEYKIISPPNLMVIKNSYPEVERKTKIVRIKGKSVRQTTKIVKSILYVPYSEGLHKPELIRAGVNYIENLVWSAMDILREREVKSRTMPDKLVADVGALSPDFFKHIPLLEWGDTGEAFLDPQTTFEKILITVGVNPGIAYNSCNKVGACGLLQFTDSRGRGTYSTLRRHYLQAQLIKDFQTGAKDHLNSMMAAILLYDYNLANLVRRYGPKILDDPLLEEYLAAAYNGNPKWVYKSLSASIAKNLDDWIGRLKGETRGYMFKLRYLQENRIP